jgi:NAD(P)H-flavin reductase
MRSVICKVDEIFLDGLATARIKCPLGFAISPGQTIFISDPIIVYKFPLQKVTVLEQINSTFSILDPIPDWFYPGKEILVDGPFGSGFTIPAGANKILLFSLRSSANLVLSIIKNQYKANTKICLISSQSEQSIDPTIELLPQQQFLEALIWADYCAIEINKPQFPILQDQMVVFSQKNNLPSIQIYIESETPCNGITTCGVCTIKNRQNKVVYLCKDGPVINY